MCGGINNKISEIGDVTQCKIEEHDNVLSFFNFLDFNVDLIL